MDAYLKKEQIGTLFVLVGASKGGGGGGGPGGFTPKITPQKINPFEYQIIIITSQLYRCSK